MDNTPETHGYNRYDPLVASENNRQRPNQNKSNRTHARQRIRRTSFWWSRLRQHAQSLRKPLEVRMGTATLTSSLGGSTGRAIRWHDISHALACLLHLKHVQLDFVHNFRALYRVTLIMLELSCRQREYVWHCRTIIVTDDYTAQGYERSMPHKMQPTSPQAERNQSVTLPFDTVVGRRSIPSSCKCRRQSS